MVKEVTMYTILCDRCGVDAAKDAEHSCWGEPEFAREMDCQEWEEIDGKDYCPNCVEWNHDETQLVPKP